MTCWITSGVMGEVRGGGADSERLEGGSADSEWTVGVQVGSSRLVMGKVEGEGIGGHGKCVTGEGIAGATKGSGAWVI